MEKPSWEETLVIYLRKISDSINSLSRTMELIDQQNRFPIVSPSDEMEKELKEQKREQNAEEQIRILHHQNDIMAKTVRIAVYGVVITAIVGVIDILLRIFASK